MSNLGKLQKFLHTLSDTNRLRIIHYIDKHESSVGEIVAETGLSQPLVSHHLKILKKNAIVHARRKGAFIYYQLASRELLEVLGILTKLAEKVDNSPMDNPSFQCPPWWWKRQRQRGSEKG